MAYKFTDHYPWTTLDTDVELNEYTKEELWDALSSCNPDITQEQFAASWARFVEMKERKKVQ